MFENPIMKDQFGRCFRFSLPRHRISDDQKIAMRFSSQDEALGFLRLFNENDSLWRRLDVDQNGASPISPNYDPLNGISDLLYKGFIKAIQMPKVDNIKNAPSKRTVSKNSGEIFQFSQAKAADPAKKVKKFGDFSTAQSYIEKTGASEKELDKIAAALDVDGGSSLGSSADKIATAMASGDVVVMEAKKSTTRASSSKGVFEYINPEKIKDAGLGPEVSSAEITVEDESSAAVGNAVPNRGVGDVTDPNFIGPLVPKGERLKIINQRLLDAPPASSADDAMRLLHRTFDGVEDAFSGVPKVANPGLKYQGRVYAPRADYTTQLPNGGLEAITKGNIVRISPIGEIEFFLKNSDGTAGKKVFGKAGAE